MYCLAVGAGKCRGLYVLMGLLELMILYSSPTASQNSGWGRILIVGIQILEALHSPFGANLRSFEFSQVLCWANPTDVWIEWRQSRLLLLVTQACIA